MIEETVNIGLVKEDEDEFYNVDTVNGNLDKIDEEFGRKVNKAEGKGLSSNDYTDEEKEKLKNIDQNANNYVHPATAGNKHIPHGGSAGQVLTYGGSSGTASWGNGSYYGTCQTAAATAAKTVSLSGFSLFTGATVAVMFLNGNTAANPTLNVNSTGAKAIYYRNVALMASTAGIIAKNGVYLFVYSGSYWRLVGDVGSIALSEVADKLSTPRTIDGVSFDGSADIVHFGVCETAANVAEKVVSIPGFVLKEGAKISVRFLNGNSVAGESYLNVNSTGAKTIVKWASSSGAYTYNHNFYCGVYEFVYYLDKWSLISSTASSELIEFNSYDTTDLNANSWSFIDKLTPGSRMSTLFFQISTMFKNVRYLYKLLGKTDISAIGDGTVTGILNGLQNKSVNITTSYTASKTINCIYNSTSCTLKLLNIENVTALTTIKIATLPEELRPGFEVIQDNVSPAGGHVRIYIKTDGTVYVYRYNNNDIYNLGIAITYLL